MVFSRPGASYVSSYESHEPTGDYFLGGGENRRPDLGLTKSLDSVRICVLSGNSDKNSPTERTGYPEPPFEKS